MEDLTFTTQSSFLHHGIEGQKWGVQNGPPYPLDRANSKRILKEKKEKIKEAQRNLNKTKAQKVDYVAQGVVAAPAIATHLRRGLKMLGDEMQKPEGDIPSTIVGIGLRLGLDVGLGIGAGKVAKTIYRVGSKDISADKEYDKAREELANAKYEYSAAKKYVKMATRPSETLTKSDMQLLDQLKKNSGLALKTNKKNENKLSSTQEKIKNSKDFKKLYEEFGSGADDEEYFNYVRETELGIKSPISMKQYNEIAKKMS